MKHFITVLSFALVWCSESKAQFQQVIFPGMSGTTLFNAVVSAYTPDTVLTYAQARDTLYSKVHNINDTVTCVYSGHKLYLAPNADPTEYLYLNGINDGINAEHAYPQSKGADIGYARSNMHHLYPTRIEVNGARQSNPFGDIPDSQTQTWFYKNTKQTAIPTQNIDQYSESRTNDKFEPREDFKGDVARAVMYMFTIYNPQMMNADPNFFEIQKETLCNWHILDPANTTEYERTVKISTWQFNKINPFIADCTLAKRLFCPNISCTTDAQELATTDYGFVVYPLPLKQGEPLTIKAKTNANQLEMTYTLYDLLGKPVQSGVFTNHYANEELINLNWAAEYLTSGMYCLHTRIRLASGMYYSKSFIVPIVH